MLPVSGAIEISLALRRSVTPGGTGGPGICVHVTPPSVLRQMPPPLATLKSSPVVVITTLGSAGTKATALVENAGRLST